MEEIRLKTQAQTARSRRGRGQGYQSGSRLFIWSSANDRGCIIWVLYWGGSVWTSLSLLSEFNSVPGSGELEISYFSALMSHNAQYSVEKENNRSARYRAPLIEFLRRFICSNGPRVELTAFLQLFSLLRLPWLMRTGTLMVLSKVMW